MRSRRCTSWAQSGTQVRAALRRSRLPTTKSEPDADRHETIVSIALAGSVSSESTKAMNSPCAARMPVLRAAPRPALACSMTVIRRSQRA